MMCKDWKENQSQTKSSQEIHSGPMMGFFLKKGIFSDSLKYYNKMKQNQFISLHYSLTCLTNNLAEVLD